MLSSVKTRKVISALRNLGFEEIRQKGSHIFFEHSDGRTTIIPLHKEIRIKLLTKIIKQDLKMDKNKFLKFLK
ncbi:MAG: type II toxin-antitoxin system HicA family toxin [Candidatus Diapherotrites archaeon]